MTDATFPLSFLAGVVSFLSPCVLPLVPSYVTFMTGISFERLTSMEDRRRTLLLTLTNALAFTAGFSTVFMALGASSSLMGQWLVNYMDWLRIVGGVVVIIFGLFIAGFVRMDFLMQERKFRLKGRPAGYMGAFIIGMAFAAGWTPCIGPMLGSILVMASTKDSAAEGAKLLMAYSAGLALPFIVSAVAFNSFLSYTRLVSRHMRAIMVTSGVLLMAFGVLLLTDKARELSALFPDLGINF